MRTRAVFYVAFLVIVAGLLIARSAHHHPSISSGLELAAKLNITNSVKKIIYDSKDGYFYTITNKGCFGWGRDGHCTIIESGSTSAVAFSRDGSTEAITTGKYLSVNRLHLHEASSPLTTVAVSNDGRWVAAGDGTNVLILDGGSGELSQTLAQAGPVADVAFSPDGNLLAVVCTRAGTTDEYNDITVWDTGLGRVSYTLPASSAVAFSEDGTLVATGSTDKAIHLFEVNGGNPKQTLVGHSEPVQCLAFSPDSKTLASGGGDKVLHLWDLRSGRILATLTDAIPRTAAVPQGVTAVAFSPDGQVLAGAFGDGLTELWNCQGANP